MSTTKYVWTEAELRAPAPITTGVGTVTIPVDARAVGPLEERIQVSVVMGAATEVVVEIRDKSGITVDTVASLGGFLAEADQTQTIPIGAPPEYDVVLINQAGGDTGNIGVVRNYAVADTQ